MASASRNRDRSRRCGKTTGSIAPRGGVVVTAGGLIFAGSTSDRKLRAYDQDNGKVVWEYDLPAPQEGVPAVYQVGGREYIAVPVGGAGVFQARPFAQPPDSTGWSGAIYGVRVAAEVDDAQLSPMHVRKRRQDCLNTRCGRITISPAIWEPVIGEKCIGPQT